MGSSSPHYYKSRFGDTTFTKVFVGGLAWETPTDELRQYFDKFGEIREAVIIKEKNTGRSKGYGFVTFRDPESARRSVMDPNPLIDGRKANCNIAALGRSRPLTQRGLTGLNHGTGRSYPDPPQSIGPPYARVTAQMPPVIYPTPYGYMAYASNYGYQQGEYYPQLATQYYHHMMHGSNGGAPTYQYQQNPQMNYITKASFSPFILQPQAHHQPYDKNQTVKMETEGSFFPQSTLPRGFQLQAPPHAKKSHAISDSEATRASLITAGNNVHESSDV